MPEGESIIEYSCDMGPSSLHPCSDSSHRGEVEHKVKSRFPINGSIVSPRCACKVFVLAPTAVANNRLLHKSTNPRINTALRLYPRNLVPT